jgi:3-methyladenine DNA glycosylase AlkD
MPKPTVTKVLAELRAHGSAEHRASKARLGIPLDSALGVSLPVIRQMGRALGRDQKLAEALWESGYHEARLLAVLVAGPEAMTVKLAERWLAEVTSWDLCDHLCNNLLIKLPFAPSRIPAWAADEREFVRRAAFALMCSLSIHHTEIEQPLVEQHLGLIRRYARDPRHYVKKAVSWALREIGKKDRDYGVLDQALELAHELAASGNAAERWVGKDALKELETLTAVPGRRRLVSSTTKSGARAARPKPTRSR